MTKKWSLKISRKWLIIFEFQAQNFEIHFIGNVSSVSTYSINHQNVRKLTISPNWLSEDLPELKRRKFPILASNYYLQQRWCFITIFIWFIISVITWQNDNKNLPILSWNFFCEWLVYVTCDISNWSLEDTHLKNSQFETNWSSDRKLELNCQ